MHKEQLLEQSPSDVLQYRPIMPEEGWAHFLSIMSNEPIAKVKQ